MKTEKHRGHKILATRGQEFAHALREWFAENARELPWRHDTGVYRTVVSELMLQQTQVATVLPYFARWLEVLPDFETLAEADEARVLKLWEGLGYYSRARNLHKLARQWVAAPEKPRSAAAWLKYPGVGPYTAAAIASMAFGEYAAVVDGNVVRILARLTADGTEFKDGSAAVKHFTDLADSLIIHASAPGPHNEAMMELGATVCLKAKPLCLLCPVQRLCAGHTTGNPEAFPRLLRKATNLKTVYRLWVIENGQLLLHRRASTERRLAGFFELPEATGLVADTILKDPIAVKKRGIANDRIEERIYLVTPTPHLRKAIAADDHFAWVPFTDLESVTLTGPHRKWITALLSVQATSQTTG